MNKVASYFGIDPDIEKLSTAELTKASKTLAAFLRKSGFDVSSGAGLSIFSLSLSLALRFLILLCVKSSCVQII